MGIGMQEMLIILLVVLVLFGAKKLPEIGGGRYPQLQACNQRTG